MAPPLIRPLRPEDYAALRALDDAVMRYAARAFLGFDWDAAAPEKREEQRAITPDAFAFYATTGCSFVAAMDHTPQADSGGGGLQSAPHCGRRKPAATDSIPSPEDDQIVGYVLAQPLRHFDLEPLAVWVEDISVHPDWHRRGIATALYQAIAARGRMIGAHVILAGIHAKNAASLALHRRVGFQVHDTKTAVWYIA